jgi:hypothetical protein
MSLHTLRVVGIAPTSDDPAAPPRTDRAIQLSLFDVRPANRILCLPIAELHGATFARILTGVRPVTVVDLRSHPHFDMTSLNRSATFDLFQTVGSAYVHLPVDLRPPADQTGWWTLRARAVEVLDGLASAQADAGRTYAFLVNRRREVPVLQAAVRQPDGRGAVAWSVEEAGPG